LDRGNALGGTQSESSISHRNNTSRCALRTLAFKGRQLTELISFPSLFLSF
jgi:hypothetical protein